MTVTKQYGSASKLIEELGISEPDEIDVEAIAEYCNATIVYAPLKGCEARILGSLDRAIITVNSNSSRPKQRFSGGHELGHWMRDRGRSAFACTERSFFTEWQSLSAEARANEFAAELLMPEQIFGRYARNREATFATVCDLAASFNTSLTATAIRLVQVGSFPAMVIYTENGERKWFVRGPDIPESVWPHESPTAYTVAADLIKGMKPTTPNEIRADNWLSGRGSHAYCVVEDSRIIAPGSILTLIWWKDERQLVDITEEEESS